MILHIWITLAVTLFVTHLIIIYFRNMKNMSLINKIDYWLIAVPVEVLLIKVILNSWDIIGYWI